MSKIIVAVTDIKYNDLRIKAGEPIPVDQFDKDTLLKLYEVGAIDKVEAKEAEASSLTPEDLKDAGTNVAPVGKSTETENTQPTEETPVEAPVEKPVEKTATTPKVESKVESKTAAASAAK